MKYQLTVLFGLLLYLTTLAQPNILWITAEDLSPRLSFYGDSTIATPNLDQLAREGVVYDRAFATYGVCAPARHSIILGMYPTSTGASAMRTHTRTSAIKDITDPELLAIPTYEAVPPPEAKCFTEYLRAAGYYCTNNSKTDYQFKTPITAWDENDRAAHWRGRKNKAMPFFAVFNFTITHESKIHNPPSPKVVAAEAVSVPPYYPNTPTVRQDIAAHYDNIIALDAQVGRLLEQLKEDGLLEETIIFFYGDHGDGLPRAKRWVYDSGIQVPLIVRFLNQKNANTRNGELVSFVDFAPTVLSLLDVDIPAYMEGQAFLGKQKAAKRQYIYACRDRMDPAFETIRAVRDHRFKYIRNYRPELPYIGFIPYRDRMKMMQEILKMTEKQELEAEQWQFWAKQKPLEELYDTATDPHEINNLAANPKYFEKLAELRQAHENWTLKYGDMGRIPEAELIKKLYPPEGKQPITANPKIKEVEGKIHIICETEGASIAYQLAEEESWLLYHQPLVLNGSPKIKSKAIRIGWKESETIVWEK